MDQSIAITSGSTAAIQTASWHDLTPIRELERLCFPQDAWPWLDMLGVLTLPSMVSLKAVEGDKITGFVAADIKRRRRFAWIATICVHPKNRGQGIGTALLNNCEDKLTVPRVRLSVRASNSTAIKLYSHSGYVQTDIWKRYYRGGEDAVVMEKNIN
ncbi:MAG: GNAT family N-acetyltransferase [Chloroflexi bacterium]|nr:GNAT family N-acetyltransferase [Chloroflexota bacterium]